MENDYMQAESQHLDVCRRCRLQKEINDYDCTVVYKLVHSLLSVSHSIIIIKMVLYCLMDEINGPTASLENARDFLFQKSLLKSSMSCPGCNAAMSLVPCSTSKSPDGLIWRCRPRAPKAIRPGHEIPVGRPLTGRSAGAIEISTSLFLAFE